MGVYGLFMAGVDNHDIFIGETYDLPWQSGAGTPTETTAYPSPGTNTDGTSILLAATSECRARGLSCIDVSPFNGAVGVIIHVQLLRNGTVVDTATITDPTENTMCGFVNFPTNDVTAPGTAGDSFKLRVVFESGGDGPGGASIDPGGDESENPSFIEVLNWFPEGIEENEAACDDLIGIFQDPILAEPRILQSYISSTQSADVAYDPPIGNCDDLGMNEDGVLHVTERQGTDSFSDWQPDTAYCNGFFVLGSDGVIYVATEASGYINPDQGTTGSSEPTWPSSGTVLDGNVTWTFERIADVDDLANFNPWTVFPGPDNCFVATGVECLGNDGTNTNVYIITAVGGGCASETCGTSGSTDPIWPGPAGDVVDNQITWHGIRTIYEGEPHAFIETFDAAGVSNGILVEFDPDVVDLEKYSAIRVDEDGSIWTMHWLLDTDAGGEKLGLIHRDAAGSVLDTWTNLTRPNGFAGNQLYFDVSKVEHKVIYTISNDFQVYEYETTTDTNLGVFYDATFGSHGGNFGPPKYLIDSKGGAIVLQNSSGGDFVGNVAFTRITEFDCTKTVKGWVPLAYTTWNPPNLLCLSDITSKAWAGNTGTNLHVVLANLNTAQRETDITFDFTATRITTCDPVMGIGFVCPAVTRMPIIVTLVGAT